MRRFYLENAAGDRVGLNGETVDWELVEDSSPSDYSTFSVAPDAVSILDTGKWLLAAGTLLTIDRITPGDERTEIRCLPAYKAFDAYVVYGAAGTSTEAYIAAQLKTQYVEQTDAVYAMPYLRISYSAGNGFAAPLFRPWGGLLAWS